MRRNVGPVFAQCHPDTLTRRFQDLTPKCGISCRLHDLRHSAATYMSTARTPIKVVEAILGHASVTTTEIYAEVLADMVRQEMKRTYE